MGIATYSYNRSTSGGEIIRELVNATDGQGLHFANGAALLLAYASGGVFGTADFSIEFILDQDADNSSDNEIYTSQIAGSNVLKVTNSISSNVVRISFDSANYDIAYDMSGDYGTPTHYVLTCDRSALATLYKNGNSVGTIDISGSSAVNLGNGNTANGYLGGVSGYGVIGTYYRWRTWKKLLSAAEVTACYENASVPITDQWSNCVTDLDFAFANPEMSLQIQSRSGAGDATASVGVSQVTPIEAVNTNKLNVGGTTPLVGIGLAAGVTPSQQLHINNTSGGSVIRLQEGSYGESVYLAKLNTSSGAGMAILDNAEGSIVVVKNNGNVGVNCTPANPLQVEKASSATSISNAQNDNALKLSNYSTAADGQFVSLGFSVAGTSGASADSVIAGYRDGAGNSSLRFYTESGNTLGERLTISSAGTTWASADGFASAYHSGADAAFATINAGATRPGIRLYNTDTGTASQNAISFKRNTTEVGTITTTNTATAFNTSSDYRLKENVTALTGALDRLDSIPVYNFNFKADPTKTVDGFLAHEVAEFVPEAIHGEKDEMQTVVTVEAAAAVEAVEATYYEDGDELPEGKAVGDEKTPAIEAVDAVVEVTEEQPKYQGIDQSKLVPLLVAAVKELKAKVTALENA